jgi:hypothetical protein
MSLQPLDGPSAQITLSVGTVTVVEAKAGVSALDERKVITLQGTGKFYVYFGDGVNIPSAATVAANGFTQFKDARESYECGKFQPVYLLSAVGTINIVVAERA